MLASLVATAPDAVIAHDAEGRIVEVNERACALFGRPRAALIAGGLAALSPAWRQGASGGLAALAPGESRAIECALPGPGGAIPTEVYSTRLPLDGPPLYVCYLRDTSARRAAAAALERREQQLAIFCNSNPAACFVKGLDGRYEVANASCAEILALHPVECIGRSDAELFPPEIVTQIRGRDQVVLESGQATVSEISVAAAAGPRSVLLHKFPVRDASGRIVGLAGIATDITDLRTAEDRLRERDQQLAAFFEHSPTACFQKDLDGRYQLVNAMTAATYGMDPVSCIGKTDAELFPREAAEAFRASDRAALARGEVTVSEALVPAPHGDRHFLVHKFPIADRSGTVVSIAGVSVEITERKRSEALLRDGEARLRAIVQGMPVLLDAFDDDGRIVAWNHECERVTGYTAAEVIGNPHALELMYPDPAYLEAMMSEARSRRDEEYSRIYGLTAKDGTQRTIEWFNVGARLKIPGWLEWSIGIDITERRRLENALHEATVLEQRRLGHDLHDGLGQELTGLSLLASSLARRHEADDPRLARELGALADIAAHAIVTCKNVARGLAPVDEPKQGLADALRRLTAAFPGTGPGLRIEFSEDAAAEPLIPLEACNHLYRIVQEALANAVRHSGAKQVRVHLHVDDDTLRLRISDDGRGVAGTAAAAGGMGLRTMRYRATAIGARLSLAPGRRGGTIVTCECANRAAQPRRFA